MLITYVRRPNGQIDEQVGFSNSVKTADLQTCNVILDYYEQKIVKCIIEGKVVPTDWTKMNDYYRKIYSDLVNQLEITNQEKRDNAK